ncbi:MAG: class I SAM-dependent methyltransferase, partial [Acidobacteria bacterium]|nr:class I SAM-dependent methyltransferase [Acidobacteriota bacterium]MCA1652364.1 class I SAM-dependent methyltransferase [Acidobacteriota bacterium]
MPERLAERLEDTLKRLKDERDEADRRYNDALTALDRSLIGEVDLPHAPPAYDEHQITPLNSAWNILPAPPVASGLQGRLTGFIWRVIAPYLQRQLAFNSLLVDHVNRNVPAHRETQRTADSLFAVLRIQLAAQAEFQSRLIALLQQITPYVDTKDRDTAGGAIVLNAALSGLSESVAKRWESRAASDERRDARMDALTAAQEELRGMVGVAQQAALTVKRELERMMAVGGTPRDAAVAAPSPGATADAKVFARALDAYKYVGFEDQFRGSREVIRTRLASYLPFFDGASDVLDIGCGRGEFLDLLAGAGISASGIDLNHEMAETCRARGLNVTEADACGFLESLPDESLGGVFSAQVVEHLEPGYLLRLLDLAFHKLRPGSPIVLETLNPACWVAFFESYIRDITHVWPLHPETLKYLVLASGFTRADVEYRSPVPHQDRLQPLAVQRATQPPTDLVDTFNANVEKLNARIFTYMD